MRPYRVYIQPVELGEMGKFIYYHSFAGAVRGYKKYRGKLYMGKYRVTMHERKGAGWKRVMVCVILAWDKAPRREYGGANAVEIRA